MDKDAFHVTEEGTPQGGIISPVLMNMTLDGLEKVLKEHFPKRYPDNPKVHIIRYADDFVRHEARYVHGARAPTADRRAVSPSP
jgi:RNA-directed DNA polymerase